ncbi:amidohydrolase family protein [uncultured Croceitalea sp.]|uniref:amidohydrolase family protein n=1 Tax=uncultured Croceitalea sp. TaxID=1798908 RepID=UPI003305AE14
MKTQFWTFLTILFLLISCNNQTKNKTTSLADKNSEHYNGPIIDMHIHAFTDGNPMLGMNHPPTLRGRTYKGVSSSIEQKEKTLESFQKNGIVKAIVTSGQMWFDDAPETILIADANKGIDELRNQYREGKLHVIAEMSPFYEGTLADDESILPYFKLAEELNIPVGFHILPGGPNYGFHLMPEFLGGMRTYNANPLQLENVLVKYPNVKVYIMHGAWPYIEDLKALMYAHPNVYIDVSVVNWILPQEELNTYLKSLINAGFGDRIMFGSDQMSWPQLIRVGIESINNVEFLTLEQKEDILYDNAAKFLNLSDKEIKMHKENLKNTPK